MKSDSYPGLFLPIMFLSACLVLPAKSRAREVLNHPPGRDPLATATNAANDTVEIQTQAENDNPEAQWKMGQLYEHGLHPAKPDIAEALLWYHKAAEQGHPDAQIRLGQMYHKGDHVEKNTGEAAKWYRKAAEQGRHFAQGLLGQFYARGDGVEKDEITAYAWFLLASEGNESMGAYIDRKVLYGRLTREQREEARKLSEKLVKKKTETETKTP